jgi:hypothetical protein
LLGRQRGKAEGFLSPSLGFPYGIPGGD